jgi:hypothetical protein
MALLPLRVLDAGGWINGAPRKHATLERLWRLPNLTAEIVSAEAHGRHLAPAGPARERQTATAGGVEPGGRGHWMIWSARARIDGAIVTPRALAVFRFTTKSNFVGCSTGMSAGLAPFKILSTKTAAR